MDISKDIDFMPNIVFGVPIDNDGLRGRIFLYTYNAPIFGSVNFFGMSYNNGDYCSYAQWNTTEMNLSRIRIQKLNYDGDITTEGINKQENLYADARWIALKV